MTVVRSTQLARAAFNTYARVSSCFASLCSELRFRSAPREKVLRTGLTPCGSGLLIGQRQQLRQQGSLKLVVIADQLAMPVVLYGHVIGAPGRCQSRT